MKLVPVRHSAPAPDALPTRPRRPRRRRERIALTAVLSVVIGFAAAAPLPIEKAQASTPTASADRADSTGSDATTAEVHSFSDEDAATTLAYWTDDRLRESESDGDTDLSGDPTTTDATVVTSVHGSIATVPWVGVLSFVSDGRDRRCSAAAIRSDSGLMVATAGHCLYSGGHYASAVAFTPGWDGVNKPHGVWAADVYQVPPEWSVRQDDSHDVAFVRVKRHAGASLADVTGASQVSFNLARPTLHYFSLAYANIGAGYTPRPLATCVGPAYTVHEERSLVMVGCAAAPGMSGGPVYHVSSTAPKGTQVGVISRTTETLHGVGTIFTPFGDVEYDVFQAVDRYKP